MTELMRSSGKNKKGLIKYKKKQNRILNYI